MNPPEPSPVRPGLEPHWGRVHNCDKSASIKIELKCNEQYVGSLRGGRRLLNKWIRIDAHLGVKLCTSTSQMCPSGCQAMATGTMAIKGATGCPRRSQFCSQRGRVHVHVHLDVEWPSPQCRPRRCGAARWTEESLRVWAAEESPARGELATPLPPGTLGLQSSESTRLAHGTQAQHYRLPY